MKYSRSFPLCLEVGGEDIEVDVLYTVRGRYHPATLEQPEEHPELEIFAVYRRNTTEVVEGLDREDIDKIHCEAWMDWDVESHYAKKQGPDYYEDTF